jgi:lipopolysaccharide/colanic/teichoic acid biosynthesis glycosyltransferase
MGQTNLRFFDVLYSSIALILLSPLLILVLILVFLQDFKNPFFKQLRVGKNQIEFSFYKIRTMRHHKNNLGEKLDSKEGHYITTKKNDKRITKIGKFLRKFSLDELPQLFNIFKGNMSFVGPRPAPYIEIKNFSNCGWNERHKIRPGLTGYSQILAKQKAIKPEEIERNDIKLVEELNVVLYHKLVLNTFLVFYKNN